MHFDDAARRRIRWLTRRGLLELDIVLGRFMAQTFHTLSDEELTVFVELLDLPDQELLALINQKEESHNPAFKRLLDRIRQAEA